MERLQVGVETKHVVMRNVGPLANGGDPADLVRQTQQIWKLKKLQAKGGG